FLINADPHLVAEDHVLDYLVAALTLDVRNPGREVVGHGVVGHAVVAGVVPLRKTKTAYEFVHLDAGAAFTARDTQHGRVVMTVIAIGQTVPPSENDSVLVEALPAIVEHLASGDGEVAVWAENFSVSGIDAGVAVVADVGILHRQVAVSGGKAGVVEQDSP